MATGLFGVVGIPFENTSELQRQVLAAFAFGMVYSVGRIEDLSPAEVHALELALLMDVYKYSDHQAAAFAQELIDSASNRGNPTFRAIIHLGIDGQAEWEEGQLSQLRLNLERVLKAVEA